MKTKTLAATLLFLSASLSSGAEWSYLVERQAELVRLVNAGQAVEALELATALRAEIAESPAPTPEWMGSFHLYRFIAAYKARRYQEAFDLAGTKEPHAYVLSPANQAYIASVRAELCLQLGRPVEEILQWGLLAADKRVEAGDMENALLACSNTWNAMALRDAEDKAIPLARRMIEDAKKAKKANWILNGYSLWIAGLRRSGVTRALPEVQAEMSTTLEGVPLEARLQARRWQVESRTGPDEVPPSNRAHLERTLGN